MTPRARSTSSRPIDGAPTRRSYCQYEPWDVSLCMGRAGLLAGAATLLLATTAAGGQAAPRLPTQAVVVPTGRGPCGAAARGASLWVAVYASGKILQLDRGGRIVSKIDVGRSACRLAVGSSAVWVTRDQSAEIVRIARGSMRRQRVRVGSAFDVVLAARSLWVSSYDAGAVARLDPRTGKRLASLRVGANPAHMTWCGGRLWVGHGREATWLTAVDPATTSARRVDVGSPTPSSPACVASTVWVATADSVLRVDPVSGAVLSRLHVGGTPADVVAAPDGLVWVTDKERSLVLRLDPDGGGVVDSFPAGPGAFAMARLGDSVWVTSFAGADVRRYDS